MNRGKYSSFRLVAEGTIALIGNALAKWIYQAGSLINLMLKNLNVRLEADQNTFLINSLKMNVEEEWYLETTFALTLDYLLKFLNISFQKPVISLYYQ